MHLDGRYRFDTFVVGSANRLAVAAARAVAEAPGSAYNPLFIYSASGLGKTHLVSALAYRATQVQPQLVTEFVSLDEFVEQLHAAVSAGQTDAFKQRWQHVDLLVIDDVQFLTGRRETQSELLRLFNTLQGSGRQVVLTSDRPPGEIADVDERLITRLAGGLIVDIGAPDYETRVAILKTKCEERGVNIRSGVIDELAKIPFGNVRELQGALNRLIAHQQLGEGELTPAQVRALFDTGSEGANAPRVTGSAPVQGSASRRSGSSGVQPSPSSPLAPPRPSKADYLSFVSDIAQAVAQHVDPWKVRVGEAVAYWRGEGYRVGVLERALNLPTEPDIDGLLATYATAVEHLRILEERATAIDASLGASEVFRDPERVAEAEELLERALSGQMPPPGPSAAFTRAGYESSASNQLAVRAADAVAAEPGRRYNPLFIHGPTGVGKTHLLHAIGNGIVDRATNELACAVVSAQTFVDELIAALQEGAVERWRARYRAADVLVIDDVHFLAGKERTQEELFHIFNALHSASKQIVLASDRPPKELEQLEDRLRSRFEGGLVVEIQAPDRALREKLFARYLAQRELVAAPELVQFLADRPAVNVREIAGIVNRLLAAADAREQPLTLELARAELEGEGANPLPAPAPAAIRAGDAYFLDDEKVIWDFPDVGARIVEDFR